MGYAIFLRAVNVGGRTLKSKELAGRLGLVNIGAAGTFVSTRRTAAAALERAIRDALPFETEVMVCPAAEIQRLVNEHPFGTREPEPGVKRFVTVLVRAPKTVPRLPLEQPAGAAWEVRVIEITGRYALTLRRRRGPRTAYPNPVIEKALGIAGTTRGWETLISVARALDGSAFAGSKEN